MKIKYRYLALIAWMVLIFLFSSEVASTSSGHSAVIVNAIINTLHIGSAEGIVTFLTRKAAHIFMYFVLGVLIYNVTREYKFPIKKTIYLSIISALTYASLDEIHQILVPGRSCELRDVVIDTVASTLGIWLFYLAYRARISRKQAKNKHKLRNKNKAKLSKWACRVTSVVLIASYVLAVFYAINMRIIPIKYLGVGIAISALAVLYITITKLKGKLSRKKNLALTIASLIMIVANICVITASIATSSFFSDIQEKNYTYEEYNVIAKKDQYISINTANKQSVGVLKTDTNNDLVKAELNKKVTAEYKEYSDLTSLTVALDMGEVNMAVVKGAHIQLLQENYDSFYRSIEVLTTFSVKIKTAGNIVPADVTKPFVVYISGIDTYGAISTVSRSDVNIIVVVNPQSHKVLLITTPRDYYVQLHGTTGVRDKLTHAGIYGINMSIKAIKDIDSKIDALDHIKALSTAANIIYKNLKDKSKKHTHYNLISLNLTDKIVEIWSFHKSNMELATKKYEELEQREGRFDQVLVSVNNLISLKEAYPNYFLDIRDFTERVGIIIETISENGV